MITHRVYCSNYNSFRPQKINEFFQVLHISELLSGKDEKITLSDSIKPVCRQAAPSNNILALCNTDVLPVVTLPSKRLIAVVLGNAIVSRIDVSPAKIITILSNPKAIPRAVVLDI